MSTIYDVIVRLKSEGSFEAGIGRTAAHAGRLDGAIGAASTGMSALGGAASGVAGVFTGMVEKAGAVALAMGKIAAVGAIGAVAYGIVGINNELEKTQIGLAAVFGANGVTNNMTDGLGLAKSVMADMRKDAAALPGEFKDLAAFFRFGANPGLKDGMGVNQLEKLSAHAMAAAASLNMPMDQAAREFGMLLSGRAGAHNILGTQLGINAKGFNSASGGDRVKQITSALDKFEPAIAEFAHSWDGLTSTARDNIKRFLGLATEPLFDKIKGYVSQFNDSIDANKNKLEEIAGTIGGKLARGFGGAVDYIMGWWPAIETFADNAETRIAQIWEKAKPFVDSIGDKAKNFLGSPDAIDHIESVLKLYAATKIGGSLFGMAGEAGGAIGGIGKIGAQVAGAGAESGPIGIAVEVAAAAAALAVLSAAAFAAWGAFLALTDGTNEFHDSAMSSWNAIIASGNLVLSKFDDISVALSGVASGAGSIYLEWLRAVGDVAGEAATALDGAARALQEIAIAAHAIDMPKAKVGVASAVLQAIDNMPAKWQGPPVQTAEERYASKTSRGAGGGGGGTHIQKVEIVVNQNDDPSRVARHVINRLASISRNPTFSSYRPNYSTGPGY